MWGQLRKDQSSRNDDETAALLQVNDDRQRGSRRVHRQELTRSGLDFARGRYQAEIPGGGGGGFAQARRITEL